jgi:hypothetical protein
VTSSATELYGRSNTSRTFLAGTSSVKGFFQESHFGVQNAQQTIVSSV